MWELPVLLPLAVFEVVDVEVDRAVEGGKHVAEAGNIGQPGRPGYVSLNMQNIILANPQALLATHPLLLHLARLPHVGDPLNCVAADEH